MKKADIRVHAVLRIRPGDVLADQVRGNVVEVGRTSGGMPAEGRTAQCRQFVDEFTGKCRPTRAPSVVGSLQTTQLAVQARPGLAHVVLVDVRGGAGGGQQVQYVAGEVHRHAVLETRRPDEEIVATTVHGFRAFFMLRSVIITEANGFADEVSVYVNPYGARCDEPRSEQLAYLLGTFPA